MGRDVSRREQAQAVFFSVVMVLSVVAIGAAGFAGSAAANTNGLTSADAENITAGQESTTQQVTFDLSLDDGEVDRIYLDVSSYDSSASEANVTGATVTGTDNVRISSVEVRDATSDDASNASEGSINEDDRVAVFNVSADTGNNANSETITVDLDVKSSGVTATNTLDYTIESQDGGNSVSLSSNSNEFDVVTAGSITVTEDNDNSISYAVSNVESGGTVAVDPGTYSEGEFDITQSVEIEATGSTDDTVVNVDTYGIGIVADDIVIDGLTISTDATDAFNLVRIGQDSGSNKLAADNVTIKNSEFKNFTTDSTDESHSAIAIGPGTAGSEVTNVSVVGNEFYNLTTTASNGPENAGATMGAVVLYGGGPHSVTVSDNQIHDVTANYFAHGISVDAGSSNTDETISLDNNTIYNVTSNDFVGDGVALQGAAENVDLTNSTIYNTSTFGVLLDDVVDINATQNRITENPTGVNVLSSGAEEVRLQNNNLADNSNYAVNNGDSDDTLDATSNWWGATNGPSGDFNGNGSAVTGSVSVDPATVSLDDGSVNLSQDFVGVVKDSQNVTLSDTSDATFSFDNESVPGEVDGTLVLGINGTDYVFKDALNEGEINTSVEGAEADSGKNGTSIANTTPTGDNPIAVVGNNSTTAVDDTGTIRLVHEVQNIGEGYSLTSLPQPAEVYTTDVSDFTSWSNTDSNYNDSALSTDDGSLVTDSEAIHKGQYAYGDSSGARIGYDFVTPGESDVQLGAGGFEELNEGFHLVGSNYNINGSYTETVNQDLSTVRSLPENAGDYQGNESFVVYEPVSFGEVGGSSTVDNYEGYWVYVDVGEDPETRTIKLARYDPAAS